MIDVFACRPVLPWQVGVAAFGESYQAITRLAETMQQIRAVTQPPPDVTATLNEMMRCTSGSPVYVQGYPPPRCPTCGHPSPHPERHDERDAAPA